MNGQSLKDPGISESYRCTATKSTRADEALSAADDDHPVDIQIIVMPYRLQRPECPDVSLKWVDPDEARETDMETDQATSVFVQRPTSTLCQIDRPLRSP